MSDATRDWKAWAELPLDTRVVTSLQHMEDTLTALIQNEEGD